MSIKIQGTTIVDDNQGLRITGVSTFTNGPVLVGSATSTGTANQRLQVTGGAYVSGSVGIGTTNPTSKLQVVGDTRVSGVVTAFDFYNDAEYPSVRPTLDLAFAQTKILDSRITFTRASTATYANASGLIASAAVNEARFDHNPETGESLGLLVEEARTNLALRSEEFDNAYWFKRNGATVTANAVAAPDGTTTGDELIHPGGTTYARIETNPGVPVTSGSQYTLSVFAKYKPSSEATVLAIQFQFAPGVAYVNLNTKTIISGDGVSIQLLSNGWVRISRTFTASSTATGQLYLYPTNTTNTAPSPSIAANSGLYIWGAQLEAGAFPTSYIPTTTATVTRAADVARMTGTNFSSWYNQSAWSMLSQFSTLASGEPYLGEFLGDASNLVVVNANSTYQLAVRSGSVNQAVIDAGTVAVGGSPSKLAVGVAVDNYAAVLNGGTIITDTVGAMPAISMTSVNLFYSTFSSTRSLNGRIARLTYYPVRLPDAQLQTITL